MAVLLLHTQTDYSHYAIDKLPTHGWMDHTGNSHCAPSEILHWSIYRVVACIVCLARLLLHPCMCVTSALHGAAVVAIVDAVLSLLANLDPHQTSL